MTFRTRREEFLAGTATPTGAVTQSDTPAAQPRDGPQPDDEDLLIGYPRMSEFAKGEGYIPFQPRQCRSGARQRSAMALRS